MKYTALLIFLLLVAISGCSVLQNSETYYLEHPRGGPLHCREYEDWNVIADKSGRLRLSDVASGTLHPVVNNLCDWDRRCGFVVLQSFRGKIIVGWRQWS